MFARTVTPRLLPLLLLGLFFVPSQQSIPTERYGTSEPSESSRQKRTFGFRFFAPRDSAPFRKASWSIPAFPPVPNFLHIFNEEELHVNLLRKIVDLEVGQQRILNYLKQLQDNKNAYACEPRSTVTASPVTTTSIPPVAVDDVHQQEQQQQQQQQQQQPLTTTTTTTTSTNNVPDVTTTSPTSTTSTSGSSGSSGSSSGSSSSGSSSSGTNDNTTDTQEIVTEEPVTETTSNTARDLEAVVQEDEEIAELDVPTPESVLEQLIHERNSNPADKNDII